MMGRAFAFSKNKILLVLFVAFAVLFIVSPYFRGLMFAENYVVAGLIIQLLFACTLLCYFRQSKAMVNAHWKLLLIGGFIPLIYTIAYWYSASPFHAADGALRWFIAFSLFFMLGVWQSVQQEIKEWLWIMCWATVSWMVLLVLLVDLTVIEFHGAIMGGRYASVLQYMNTFAALVSAFMIAGLMGLSQRIPLFYQLLYGLSLVPFMVALLFTESRGGLLVFVLGWIVALFFLKKKEQLTFIGQTLVLMAFSFVSYAGFVSMLGDERFITAAVLLVLFSLIFAGFVVVMHRYVYIDVLTDQQGSHSFALPVSGLIMIVAGLIVWLTQLGEFIRRYLPDALQSRMENFTLEQHSVQERWLFFQDSFVLWMDHFWFGTGGGGWAALFEGYKSYPYISTQVHNFYLQTLVEVGLIGGLIVFSFLFVVLGRGVYTYFRMANSKISIEIESETKSGINPVTNPVQRHLSGAVLVAVIIGFVHSLIDFNMSMGTYQLFMFVLLAIIWHDSQHPDGIEQTAINQPTEQPSQYNKFITAGIVLVLAISLFSIYKSFSYIQAEQLYRQAIMEENFYQALEKTEQAVNLHPNHMRFREHKVELLRLGWRELDQGEYLERMIIELDQMLDLEVHRMETYERYAELLWSLNEHEQAIEKINKATQVAPWIKSPYMTYGQYQLSYWSRFREEIEPQVVEQQVMLFGTAMAQLTNKLSIQEGELPSGLDLRHPIEMNAQDFYLLARAHYVLAEHEHSLVHLNRMDEHDLSVEQEAQMLLLTMLNYAQMGEKEAFDNVAESASLEVRIMFDQAQEDEQWQPSQ